MFPGQLRLALIYIDEHFPPLFQRENDSLVVISSLKNKQGILFFFSELGYLNILQMAVMNE